MAAGCRLVWEKAAGLGAGKHYVRPSPWSAADRVRRLLEQLPRLLSAVWLQVGLIGTFTLRFGMNVPGLTALHGWRGRGRFRSAARHLCHALVQGLVNLGGVLRG